MFTDIAAAIEEAAYLRHNGDFMRHFKVVQKPGGVMQVVNDRGEHDSRTMWSTRGQPNYEPA